MAAFLPPHSYSATSCRTTASPLADYYPGLAGFVHAHGESPPWGRLDGDPYPSFRSFCREHEDAIARLLETRRVQTNEVGRAACLLPAFGLVARRAGRRPLALVEIGASAGLLLLWDRYGYDYGGGSVYGDAASSVRVRCAARGNARPPIPAPFPSITYRVGLDLDPVDARDGNQALWLRALVWPEHAQRAALLIRALEVARRDPPPLCAGDALELLPDLLLAIPSDAAVCLYHCYTLNQWPREARAPLGASGRALPPARPLPHLARAPRRRLPRTAAGQLPTRRRIGGEASSLPRPRRLDRMAGCYVI